jgi:hypothetical protein
MIRGGTRAGSSGACVRASITSIRRKVNSFPSSASKTIGTGARLRKLSAMRDAEPLDPERPIVERIDQAWEVGLNAPHQLFRALRRFPPEFVGVRGITQDRQQILIGVPGNEIDAVDEVVRVGGGGVLHWT